MAKSEVINNTTLHIPDISNSIWRNTLLTSPPPQFIHLPTQLLFSRLQLILQVDPSEATLQASAIALRDFFIKNEEKISQDIIIFISHLESQK